MSPSETMQTVLDYQLNVLEKLILDDLNEHEELIAYDTKDVQDIFDCSRSTAWRILQGAVDSGMLTKHYVNGKKMIKCIYRACQDYQGWFDI